MSQRWTIRSILAAVLVASSAFGATTSTTYIGPAAPADWATPGNWNNGVPVTSASPLGPSWSVVFTSAADFTSSANVPTALTGITGGSGLVEFPAGMNMVAGVGYNPGASIVVGTGGMRFGGQISQLNGSALISIGGNLTATSLHWDGSGQITQSGGLIDISDFEMPSNVATFDIIAYEFAHGQPSDKIWAGENAAGIYTFKGTPVFLAGHRPAWLLTSGSATGANGVFDLNGFTMVGHTIDVHGGGFVPNRYATLKNELGVGAGPGGVIDANTLNVGGFLGVQYDAPYLDFQDPVTVTLRGAGTIYNNYSVNNDATGKIVGSVAPCAAGCPTTWPAPFKADTSTLILDPAGGAALIDTGSEDRNSTNFPPADWVDNFAWDLVIIGDGDTITLTGDANVGAGNNALYARTMECVGSSGTIDLNGHNVYLLEAPTCVTFDDSGGGAVYYPGVTTTTSTTTTIGTSTTSTSTTAPTENPFLTTDFRQLNPSSKRTEVIISEIMYNAGVEAGTNNADFVEIFNTRPVDVDISGWRVSGDADFTFPSNTILKARDFLVIARDPAHIQSAYGVVNVVGPLDGGLPAAGGTVRLRNRLNATLLEVRYDDDPPWPAAADGAGHSLYLARPDFGERDVRAWSASSLVGGSPGTSDLETASPFAGVMLNEILAHTDEPQIDFIELFNAGPTIDISGCTLSDDPETIKFTVPPGTFLSRGAFIVFDQTNLGFNIRSEGDDIFLRNPDGTRVLDGLRLPAQVNGVSVGRYPDGAPDFHALETLTPGSANASTSLKIEDIVINEIMYRPISADNDHEYVELYNRGTGTVDVGYWRFTDGIDFSIPPGTTIPGGGFLVVAENALVLRSRYAQLNTLNTIGDYGGSLSDRGERIVLSRPDDLGLPFQDFVTVDEVTYDDGARWGEWSDGGGSSLELVDPRSDNRRAMNWAGSDETGKAPWTTIDYTDTIDQGSGTPSEMRMLILQGGECLLDDVEIRNADTTLYLQEGFESGIGTFASFGNHSRSELETTEGASGSQSLFVRASGAGNLSSWGVWGEPFQNHIRAPLVSDPGLGATVNVKAKVRWLAGWPHAVMSIDQYWMEAPLDMEVPIDLGSPGLANSRFQPNAGPAIGDVTHTPILPAAGEDAIVTCRVGDPDGIDTVTLKYRFDPSAALTETNMNDGGLDGDATAGDGTFSVTIPGQAAGERVAFHIVAADHSVTNRFPIAQPVNSPELECLIRFGQTLPSGVIGNYIMWMTDANIARWNSLPGGADNNEPQDLTFVYGNHRVIYNTGGRYRGLGPRSYVSPVSSGSYAIELPEERFQGQNEFKLDQIGQEGVDASKLGEGFCFWIAEQIDVPGPRVHYARVNVNGTDRGLLHDLQTPARDFAKAWFNDPDPQVFKSIGWDGGDPFSEYRSIAGDFKKSRYRWFHVKRRMDAPNNDFSQVFKTVAAAATPDDVVYEARIDAVADIRGWASFFAICGATRAWDHYGWTYQHNFFTYAPRTAGSSMFIYDMDHTLSNDIFAGLPLFPEVARPVPTRMFSRPRFRRVYWAVLEEIVKGPYSDYESFFDNWYTAFANNGAPTAQATDFKAWIADARMQIVNALLGVASGFEITSNGGADLVTSSSIVTLQGIAPVNVAEIRINGIANRVTYPATTAWSLQVGLQSGTNVLNVTAYDWRGNHVTSDVITVTQLAERPPPTNDLVITEIMYHPLLSGEEYVEIHNRSATETYDLRGWRLNGVGHVFGGGSLIGPGEYKVLVENIAAYQYAYSNAEHVVGDYTGDLDNGGETLSLQMPVGSNNWLTIDKVRYDDGPPWPPEADGLGSALQLIDPGQDNNVPGNWSVDVGSLFTPGVSNTVLDTLPALAHLRINEVMPSNTVTFADNAGDFDPWIEIINLDPGPVDLSLYRLSDDYADLDKWAFPTGILLNAGERALVWADGETGEQVPGFMHTAFRLNSTTGSVVLSRESLGSLYVVDHLDYGVIEPDASFGSFPEGDSTSRQVFDNPTPGFANNPTSTPVNVAINEWMPDNSGTVFDPTDGTAEDWFELYNPGSQTVNIGQFFLTDDLSDTNKFEVPGGTLIAPRGFLLVWADGDTGDNGPGVDLHVNFSLARSGEEIGLFARDGKLVDAIVFGPLNEDQSEGSWPDGANAVYLMSPPTPAGSNMVFIIREVTNEDSPDGFKLSWIGDNGTVYRIETADSLVVTNWSLLAIVTATTSEVSFTDTNAPSKPVRFYRISEL